MSRAVQVVWGTGLAGALVGTVVILKEVSLVLRALQDIHRLAEMTRDAARGVEANVAAAGRVAALEGPALRVREAGRAAAATAASVERKVDGLPAGSRGGE